MKLYKFIAIFILFSFLGWCLELVNEIVFFKKFNPQYSYLLGKEKYKLPLLPIYGVGFFILYFIVVFFFRNNKKFTDITTLIIIFIVTTVILTCFELIVGICTEMIYKKQAWNYTGYSKYHFLGYVDIMHSFAWGILASILVFTLLYFQIEIN